MEKNKKKEEKKKKLKRKKTNKRKYISSKIEFEILQNGANTISLRVYCWN